MKRMLALVIVAVLLAGCGPQLVRSNVTRFHSLPPTMTAGQSFTILPTEQQRGSLEFQAYADRVAAALQARGFRPVPASAAGDYVVFLRYGVGDARTEIYSQDRFYGGANFGWGSHYHRYGLGAAFPLYYPEVYSRTLYTRFLEMDILDGPSFRDGQQARVFEGRAVSEGGSRAMPEVMPYLVTALFDNFPGQSGRTVQVAVPIPGT